MPAEDKKPPRPSPEPEPPVPDLKKQDEERKKSGVVFGGGKAPGSVMGAKSSVGYAARAVIGTGTQSGGGSIVAALPRLLGSMALTGQGAAAAAAFVGLALGGIVFAIRSASRPTGPVTRSSADFQGVETFKGKIASMGESAGLGGALQMIRSALGSPAPKGQAAGGSGASKGSGAGGAASKTGGSGAAGRGPGAGESGAAGAAGEEKDKWQPTRLSGQRYGEEFGGKNVFSRTEAVKFGYNFDRSKIADLSNSGVLQMGKTKSGGGSGGQLVRTLRPTDSGVALGRHGMRSSRALAQLRSMGTMNRAILTGGTRTNEAQSASALAQFEGAGVVGGTTPPDAPPGGEGGETGGGGPGAAQVPSGGSPPATDDFTPLDCGKDSLPDYTQNPPGCKAITKTDDHNATPWQTELDAANGLMICACVLTLIGGILMNTSNQLQSGVVTAAAAAAMKIAAFVLLGVAMACATTSLGLGIDIAVKGGTAQGVVIAIAGGVIDIEAALAMAGKVSNATLAVTMGIAALVSIIQLAIR